MGRDLGPAELYDYSSYDVEDGTYGDYSEEETLGGEAAGKSSIEFGQGFRVLETTASGELADDDIDFDDEDLDGELPDDEELDKGDLEDAYLDDDEPTLAEKSILSFTRVNQSIGPSALNSAAASYSDTVPAIGSNNRETRSRHHEQSSVCVYCEWKTPESVAYQTVQSIGSDARNRTDRDVAVLSRWLPRLSDIAETVRRDAACRLAELAVHDPITCGGLVEHLLIHSVHLGGSQAIVDGVLRCDGFSRIPTEHCAHVPTFLKFYLLLTRSEQSRDVGFRSLRTLLEGGHVAIDSALSLLVRESARDAECWVRDNTRCHILAIIDWFEDNI